MTPAEQAAAAECRDLRARVVERMAMMSSVQLKALVRAVEFCAWASSPSASDGHLEESGNFELCIWGKP